MFAQLRTDNCDVCSVLADEERWRRRYGAGGVHRLGTGQALRPPGSAKDRAHAQAAKHARRRVYLARGQQDAMRDACSRGRRCVSSWASCAGCGSSCAPPAGSAESGTAYRRPSRGWSLTGLANPRSQPEARASHPQRLKSQQVSNHRLGLICVFVAPSVTPPSM